ncbi:hypothetical protein O0I10_006311 [Lichtheimia ornata]|uniref:F-box domain-containing protein n=1 Tax=Lichtheimia ornata TaxID=688661 RepID=A0AAD7XXE1_9FUNG|nr:uncharacterized protein O0I10_006311 [Lichtheimia ornata]KAJ8658040.1 hypothetical protein O0I10_006311 [Lichtheimia ornata]
MDDSIWHDLCKQPTLKASSEKYAHLVHDSTIQLLQPIQSILSALDRRAIGLTKCANSESALRDAKVMQHLSPSSALGYLREAHIYSEQGQHLQVIDICNKAFNNVDNHDTHYATLQQVKEDAEQRQNTCIDFIKQLPTDIVITTLIPLLMDDSPMSSSTPSPCLYVSKLWRDRFIQCFNGLCVKVGDTDGHNVSHVVQLSRYIRRLKVQPDSEDSWFYDLLHNNDFCSLRELYIGLGSTLTHFEITVRGGSIKEMADIMQSCPNLVSLDIDQPMVPDFTSLSMSTWPKLTTLSLMCDSAIFREVFTRDHLRAIPNHFPSLKKLSISPCEDTQMTRIVLDNYPWMKRLELSHGPDVHLTYLEQGNPCNEIGITDLLIESDRREFFPWGFLAQELRQHQNTLERIECNMYLDDETEEEDEDILDDVSPIEYTRLRLLDLSCFGWWIPRKAPMLEELKITAFTIEENSAVLDTIPPKLKKLELNLDDDFGYTAPLERYLHGLAQHSQFKELVIRFYKLKNIDNILNAIHRLDHLQRLMVSFSTKCDYYQMQKFIDGLVKGCPRLACLEIQCINAPSTYSLNALKQLEHLERFAFSIKGMGDNDGFWNMIQGMSQLKCIRIYPASAAKMDAVRRLQEQRLDMKIVLDRWFTRFEDTL